MIKYPKREDLHLIALDLDGTVLCPKSAKPITSRLRKIIRSLHQSGLPVTFVTGRTEDHAAPIARDLGLDVPLVTYNGARVFCPVEEKILHQSLIESKVASEISRWLGETEEVVACYLSRKGDLHLVQSRCSGNPEHDDFLFGTPRHLVGDLSSAIEGGGEVVKMIVSTQRPLQSEIPHLFGQVAQVVRTHEELVEILPIGVSKGEGLLRLCKHLNIAPQNVLAIGDQENDISSFQVCGYSVAMGDSPEAVKQAAGFVTQTFAEDGCAQALERLSDSH